jgi:uracil-DNA glycosylase
MSNEFSPYVRDIRKDVREHMERISVCRRSPCPVPDKHWFYPTPNQPPFYYGKRPCMPVVPTRLVSEKVMILGAYPTCRFATIGSEEFVPVKDIDEPFEDSRYFDNYSVRDVRSGDVLYEGYLGLLGLDPDNDTWITNMVKCFLFKPGHINAYRRLGWTDPNVEPTRYEYFKAAAVCMTYNLKEELELCEPELVITMGGEVCRMIHGSDDGRRPAPYDLFKDIVGQPLRANTREHPQDSRNELFEGKNVFHLYHPGFVMRKDDPETDEETKKEIERHYTDHIPAARAFLVELGLADDTLLGKPITEEGLATLTPFVDRNHAIDIV